MITLFVIISIALYGCGAGKKDSRNNQQAEQSQSSQGQVNLKGKIDADGSSTVYLLTSAIAEEFQNEHTGVHVTVGSSGTGSGFKRFCRGEISISSASRIITDAEKKACQVAGIHYIKLDVAYDGIPIVINPGNTWVDKLTLAELKTIFEPESQIKTWADVRQGWPNEKIQLYSPGVNSGTFDYFTEIINKKSKAIRNNNITFSEDDNTLVQGVSGNKRALGYFGFAYYEENKDKLKVIPIDNGKSIVVPTFDTIKEGTYVPLSRPLYLYVNKKELSKPEIKGFVQYYVMNAGKLAKEVGYVSLPENKYTEQLLSLE